MSLEGKISKQAWYDCELGEPGRTDRFYYHFPPAREIHVPPGAIVEGERVDFICVEPPCNLPPIKLRPNVTCDDRVKEIIRCTTG